MEDIVGPILLQGIDKDDVEKIRLLSDGAELAISNDWMISQYSGVFVSISENPVLPDRVDTVIEVTLK